MVRPLPPSRFAGLSVPSVVLAFALAGAASAQPASLVRDINPVEDFYSGGETSISSLRPVGDRLFFISNAEGSGEEVWVSDGTSVGTEMVQDVCPGPCSSEPVFLETIGNLLYWTAAGDSGQRQLWRSDGTRTGTFALTGSGVSVDYYSGDARPFWTAFGGSFYFRACRDSRCSLWRSNGTVAGTQAYDGETEGFYWVSTAGSRLFSMTAGSTGLDLWSSQGTPETRVLLRHFENSFASSDSVVTLGNQIFFPGRGSFDQGVEVWASDGTVAGTRPLTAFSATDPFGFYRYLAVAGDRLYFTANDGAHGRELYRSDGTPAGTLRVSDFATSEPFGDLASTLVRLGQATLVIARNGENEASRLWLKRNDASSFVALPVDCGEDCELLGGLVESGGQAYFKVTRFFSDAELWATKGTGASTKRLTTSCDRYDCMPGELQASRGGILFLRAVEGRLQLWRSDGTAASTRPLSQLPDPVSAWDLEVAEVGGDVYFAAGIEGRNSGLWVRDRSNKTRPVRTYPKNRSSSFPGRLAALGDQLLFTASADGDDALLWSTKGTPADTVELPVPGVEWDYASRFLRVGNLLYFQTESGSSATNLWRTDGTLAGTFVVAHLPSSVLMVPHRGGLTYFEGGWIWHTDGTVAGTVKTGDLPEGVQTPTHAEEGPDGLLLEIESFSNVGGLYLSDGTNAGTRRLLDFSASSGDIADYAYLGSTLYFAHRGIWKSDGTEAGTVSVSAGVLRSDAYTFGLTPFDGALYFLARDYSSSLATELWRTDGTPAGTTRIASFTGRRRKEELPQMVTAGDRLFFSLDDGQTGWELWSSDGTATGTALVRDLVPGPRSSDPLELTVADGRLYFTASDALHGRELWQSDGTAAGTHLVQDIGPQAASSNPERLTVAGDRLYFTADDGLTGRELWTVPLGGSTACRPSATRLCLSGGRYAVEATWEDGAGHRGQGNAAPLTTDTGTFWFFDPANIEVVLKVLDGRGVNEHVWVFYGALSNVEYTLTVTDTQTGLVHRYLNPQGELASVADTRAFGPLGASAESVTTVAGGTGVGSALALTSRKVVPRAATGACAPSSTRLCLNGGRYGVEAVWKDFAGNTGVGQANGLTADTGWFWFFDPANVELVLKVLDGTPVNGHTWVFYGALSSVEYTVTVTDTQTGEVRTYRNPSGQLASVADTSAF